MNPSHSVKAVSLTIILLIVSALGIGGYGLSKTKWFHGETQRAATSTATTNALLDTTANKDAAAAAYVTTIGAANSTAPDSREKEFIGAAVPIALGYIGAAPDPKKLLEAEKLKNAFLTGQLAVAQNLTATALQDASSLRSQLTKAIAAKRGSDLALEQAAAEVRGAEQQAFWFMLVAGSAALLYAYTKLTHTSPWALAKAVTDIRSGVTEPNQAIAAIDGATTPLQQLMVKAHSKIIKATNAALSP